MTTHTASDRREGLLLPGLDGANPLGFLAALGLFRVLDGTNGSGQARMKWLPGDGTWIPALTGHDLDQESLLTLLTDTLPTTIDRHPVRMLEALGMDEPSQRHELFRRRMQDASTSRRVDADWLAALASDVVPASAINQLQTTRRDYHYGNLTSVIRRTTRAHLRRAIFAPWDYADPLDNQSLHLDPSEDRRHAHQWNRPSSYPERRESGGMLGANRLAIEAFALFTSLPNSTALRTIGFTGQRSRDTRWTWPIWNVPISLPELRSLLALAELQRDDLSVEVQNRLRHRGVATVFRTARILVGKTPNFTPPQRVA